MTPRPVPSDLALRMAGVAKSYGRVVAVDGLDLTVGRGEVVALLGPNGAGKSTSVDMMLGLATPDRGTVEVLGGSPGDAVRNGWVGAMLQDGQLPPDLTVKELLTLVSALYSDPAPVAETLEHTGLVQLAGRRAGKLSGGQTQRVRFALAMVSNPRLLLLDEPTAGMDVESRLAFWSLMRAEAAAGRTVLFATHYLEEADEHADRIVVIQRGRLVADGSATEIKSIVAERVLRATLSGADEKTLATIQGVGGVRVRGDSVELRCSDSDTALRVFLDTYPDARDVEVSGAGLTDAFVALTAEPGDTAQRSGAR